ncbi:type II secretion system protein GspC [Pleionea sediminis]|uniref:type II secretion system protein GspC n=1 Tax=Pleionea sediminis TaxID=2569479 RepID=UPI001185FBEA|nr:type II secretion system protein GspC [Pleionea sediminis]
MQLDAALVNRFNKPEPWIKLGSGVLLVISLYLLAKLVWLWVDASVADYRVTPPARQATAGPSQQVQVSVRAITSKHLFGDATAIPQADPEPIEEEVAGETPLPLKLRGIYASDDSERASAIIESGGANQEVYFLGDVVSGAQGAKLHQVQANKVILNRNGRLESLTLEESESVISMQTDARQPEILPETPDRGESLVVDNARVKREFADLKEKLQSDPASLKDLIRWQPVMENGLIKGVKISPGKARRLFYELKLRRNDIVTNINGVPLNDPSQLMMLQQNLANASEVSLTLLRNGQSQDITVKLGGQ